jgi:alkylation response protein AidB-like acyl-CoA dehydrogenase
MLRALDLDLALEPDDRAYRDRLRDWLADHLVGEYREHLGVGGPADNAAWDVRIAWEKELAAAGYLSITWPREYGGQGGTLRQELVFQIEHARARAPYWAGVHGRDLFGPTLLLHGTEAQKRRFLPPICRVEELWGQGFSEPDAGSDLASLRTAARLEGDEWVVDGEKIWMTFGMDADWMYVLCRTDRDVPKHRGISMLLVPAHQEGVEVRPIRNLANGREFAEVFFDGARTPAENVVGPVNGGWGVAISHLGNERAGAAVLPYEMKFEAEMEQLVALVCEHAADGPVLRDRLARSWSELQILRLMNSRTLEAVLLGEELGPEASVTKIYWSRWHQRFGELVADVRGLGGLAVGEGYHPDLLQKAFLDSRAETIYGGADQIQHDIVGERVLGLPRGPR